MKIALAVLGDSVLPCLLCAVAACLWSGAALLAGNAVAGARAGPRVRGFQGKWLLGIVVVLLVLMDLPITRTEYSMCIARDVQPLATLWQDAPPPGAEPPAEGMCDDARKVVFARQACVEQARDAHFFAAGVSQLFDAARGTDQAAKLEKLLANRPCLSNIRSAVKTNRFADLATFAVFAVAAFVACALCFGDPSKPAFLATAALVALPHLMPVAPASPAMLTAWAVTVCAGAASLRLGALEK
eukprot:TRINITY_DN25613_c0_g1_i1.p1 TRINITY_DN25613_c0_g1~~TRINITY_DN25613_c0_g1_i1.p1  ORF type:complete len:243 (+),score=67.34 TRINITY_DN25613_c0_g1_i1:53-781(+)